MFFWNSLAFSMIQQMLAIWRLSTKEPIFSNYVLEKTFESPLNSKDIKPINPKINQLWIFIGRIDVETEAPILWPPEAKNWLIGKDHDARWGRLKVGEEGDKRGWDGWMASPTRWTWVWASSERWWRTAKPGMLLSMGSQRVRHDRATEQQISIL